MRWKQKAHDFMNLSRVILIFESCYDALVLMAINKVFMLIAMINTLVKLSSIQPDCIAKNLAFFCWLRKKHCEKYG